MYFIVNKSTVEFQKRLQMLNFCSYNILILFFSYVGVELFCLFVRLLFVCLFVCLSVCGGRVWGKSSVVS